jgi:hypothetical protein
MGSGGGVAQEEGQGEKSLTWNPAVRIIRESQLCKVWLCPRPCQHNTLPAE